MMTGPTPGQAQGLMSGPLAGLEQQCWEQLAMAVTERSHSWRFATLATTDAQGAPQARTVVLREVDRKTQTLSVYTDARSPKIDHLQRQPNASLVFWCPMLQWQLRVQARAGIVLSGPDHQQVSDRIRHSRSAADYLSVEAPGSPLADTSEMGATFTEGSARSTARGPGLASLHLAIIRLEIKAMDWLALNARGHQRARFEPGCPPVALQP